MYGKVLSVETRNLGEPTVAAAAIGDTVLYVADASTFDEAGGQATVAGEILSYASIDADLDTITLAAALTVAVDEQALVEVYPPLPVKTALVDLGDDGDPIPATVPHALKDKFVDGTRNDENAESVTVEQRSLYEWVVVDSVAEPVISASLDYVEGEEGYGFDSAIAQLKDAQVTGELGAAVVNAETMILDGADLGTELSNRPRGAIAFAMLGTAGLAAAGNTSGTTPLKLFEFYPGDIVAGTQYEISVKANVSISVAGDGFDVFITYTTDGTTPTTASTEMPSGRYRLIGGGSLYYQVTLPNTVDGPLKMALCMVRSSGTGFGQILVNNPALAFQWTIKDAGLVATATATDRLSQSVKVGGGSDPAPLSTFVKTWRATRHDVYAGNAGSTGLPFASNDGFAWQGWSSVQGPPPTVNDKGDFSVVYFDMTSIMATLATAVSFTSCKVNFRVRTRDVADGLDVGIFTHTYSTTPPVSLASDFLGEVAAGRIILNAGSLNNCAPQSAYSVEIGPTLAAAFKAGTRRGIGFYTLTRFPNGRGAVHGVPMASRPQLTFTYKAP